MTDGGMSLNYPPTPTNPGGAMPQFCAMLAEFLHKELRTTLVNCERFGEFWFSSLWFGHEWMANFMNGRPAFGVAQKGAASMTADPRWYLLYTSTPEGWWS